MHHIEYLIVIGTEPQPSFDVAVEEMCRLGYRLDQEPAPRHAGTLCAWPIMEGKREASRLPSSEQSPLGPPRDGRGTRLLLPRGFDRGDLVALALSQKLAVPTLRLFAEAGMNWGYDACTPGRNDASFSFRSERPRRADESAQLALWAGQGVKLARSITPLLDPTGGAEGPAAIEALAQALGAPYPSGAEHNHPSLRALLSREEKP